MERRVDAATLIQSRQRIKAAQKEANDLRQSNADLSASSIEHSPATTAIPPFPSEQNSKAEVALENDAATQKIVRGRAERARQAAVRKIDAATQIQKIVRGKAERARQAVARKTDAATQIQKIVRGKAERARQAAARKTDAATQIQKIVRGKAERARQAVARKTDAATHTCSSS